MNSAKITFYGGAGTVTGANFLLDSGNKKILIDCGALEREHLCDSTNSRPFAYDAKSIDALIVTHAHADHIGRVPKLALDGFRGVIYSTPATRDLARIMLEDALSVMTNEAKKHGCEIMYEKHDVDTALSLWKTHEYHEHFGIGDASVEFLDAGHILGSAMAKFTREGRVVIFTGDLGNSPEPLLRDTESAAGANYLVMESVYGDRVHEARAERAENLRLAIEETREKNGVLLIPSFSLERTQILLYELDKMIESGDMAPIPVYLDAPLAIRITEVFRNYPALMNTEAQKSFEDGNDPFVFKGLKLTEHLGESRAIHDTPNPKVIIAGAGMSAGGRIRAHELAYLGDKKATVMFVGYQAPGSLGRRIQDGEKNVRIDGESVRVNASISSLSGYSGHKDRDGLVSFVETAGHSLERVFVVMGEPKPSQFIAQRLQDFLGVDAVVPESAQTVDIQW